MGVKNLQYAQELERQLGKGKSVEEAHKQAAKKATVKATVKKTEKPTEAGLIKRTKQKIAKLLGKKKTVKPTAGEKQVIQKRLKKKYPQMAQAGWGKPKKKKKI